MRASLGVGVGKLGQIWTKLSRSGWVRLIKEVVWHSLVVRFLM